MINIAISHMNYTEVTSSFCCYRPSQDVPPADANCNDNTQVMDYLPLEKQYLAAECLGKSGGDCDAAYPDCPESPLDYISQTVQLEIFPE
jgi:hypothetical protein